MAFKVEPVLRFKQKYRIDKKSGCWVWTSAMSKSNPNKSYVRTYLWLNGGNVSAARFSYENFVGEIPKGMFVCHKCDNCLCVNPDHLFIGSHKDNVKDLMIKKKQMRGDNHPSRKLNSRAVLEIFHSDLDRLSLSTLYSVSPAAIWAIKKGYTWCHITGKKSIRKNLLSKEIV